MRSVDAIHTCSHLFFIWCESVLLLDTGTREVYKPAAKTRCSVGEKIRIISKFGQPMVFTSCCLKYPRRANRVQYSMCGCVLAFPSPTPFLRVGCRRTAIGKKRKKKKKVGEEGTDRGGGGASLNKWKCLDQQNDLPRLLRSTPVWQCAELQR